MYVSIFAQILAGLGLFFVGIKLLSTHMQQLASARLRQLIGKATNSPLLASLIGAAGGFIMQKPSGVIAILASMQAGGLITLRQAMPIIAWCNIGLALLAFYVVIPLSVAVSFLIGISGLCVMFAKIKKRLIIATAIFGAALLFYGLEEMKEGTAALRQFEWFQRGMLYANASPLVALGIGAFVAAITQSFIAIAIMAVSLVDTGALGAPQAMMIIYGANFGVGFFRRLMTASLTGESKQLFLYQNFFRYVGTIGSVLLFYGARVDGTPLMLYVARLFSAQVDTQLALVFLFCNLPAVLVGSLFQEQFARLVERLSPPTVEDQLTRLVCIATADPADPEASVPQIRGELTARIRRLADYMGTLRKDGNPNVTPELLHHSTDVILNELTAFEQELLKRPLPSDTMQTMSRLLNIHALVRMLDGALFRLAGLMNKSGALRGDPATDKTGMLIETLDTFILSLADALDSNDPKDIGAVLTLTTDKASLMEQFRIRYLADSNAHSAVKQDILLALTNDFEHAVWMIHRIAALLNRQ